MPDFGSAAVQPSPHSGEATQSAMIDVERLDDYINRARAFITDGRLDSEEMDYKLKIGTELGQARDAVFAGNSEWPSLVRNGLSNNLADWRDASVLEKWFEVKPDDAREALQSLWEDDETLPGERISTFAARVPEDPENPGNFKGAGSRLRIVSLLLMALGPSDYPPFKTREFNKAYRATGYPVPPRGTDEAGLYDHALIFLDKLVERVPGLDLDRPRNRLEAQSVVWKNETRPDPLPNATAEETAGNTDASPESTSLRTLAEELMLDAGFLQRIESLLKDKRQIIFQGPPGTGKTFVARKLAACLAGSPERVRLIQFHPSYAYEDFVQGFRPSARWSGQPGFDAKERSAARHMAERALRDNPGAKHFLVIDEINRGNLAKVFGELYLLAGVPRRAYAAPILRHEPFSLAR